MRACGRLHKYMAAVQGIMTLDHQQNKMYNSVQNNCVIVPNGYVPNSSNSIIQSKRVLAPAPERNTVLMTNNTDMRCKRKIQFISHSGPSTGPPASVARRNARERNRVKQVNNGFAALRQHIPANVLAAFTPPGGSTPTSRGANKKLSKVETLKLAVEYIRSLKQMLDDNEAEMSSPKSSVCENTISDNRFYTSSPDNINQQFSPYPILLPTPPSSEASASPTPSHSSDGSPVFTTTTVYKPYGYDNNYEPHSPEDEELLDAIFSWQQNS